MRSRILGAMCRMRGQGWGGGACEGVLGPGWEWARASTRVRGPDLRKANARCLPLVELGHLVECEHDVGEVFRAVVVVRGDDVLEQLALARRAKRVVEFLVPFQGALSEDHVALGYDAEAGAEEVPLGVELEEVRLQARLGNLLVRLNGQVVLLLLASKRRDLVRGGKWHGARRGWEGGGHCGATLPQ